MSRLTSVVAFVWIASMTACIGDDPIASTEQDITPAPVITSYVDLGTTTSGSANGPFHEVNLVGTFPLDDASHSRYLTEAFCNGIQLQPPSFVGGTAGSVQRIRFAEPPTGSRCWFRTIYDDDDDEAVGPGDTPAIVSLDPINLLAPAIEIRGAIDAGVTGGNRYYELYGGFPPNTAGTYTAEVKCNSLITGAPTTMSSAVVYGPIGGQVNISFADAPAASSCRIRVKRTSTGQWSATWRIRIGSAPSFPSSRGVFGAYHWGGFQPPSYVGNPPASAMAKNLTLGSKALRDAGLRSAARFVMEPRMRSQHGRDLAAYNVYNFATPFCPPGPGAQPYLECAANHPEYRDAFTQMGYGATIVLTVLDAASAGDFGGAAHYFDAGWLANPANATLVRNEYKQLAYALIKNNNNSASTFIIDNWETDSLLFCGDVWGYRTSKTIRDQCQYGSPSIVAKEQGLIAWFNRRREGIDDGIAAAHADGYGGVEIRDGIEIAALHILDILATTDPTAFRTTTIAGIIPALDHAPRHVTYSAHESFNAGRVERDLAEIKLTLPVGTPLGIGEIGPPGMADTVSNTDVLQWRFLETMKAVWRAQVSPVIVWEGFTSVPGLRDGILAADGSERPLATNFRSTMIGYAAAGTMPGGSVRISSVTDLGPQSGSNRDFQLSGLFPSGAAWQPRTWCDGGDLAPSVVGSPTTSVIRIRVVDNLATTAYCQFWVERPGLASSVFGPARFCANAPGSDPYSLCP